MKLVAYCTKTGPSVRDSLLGVVRVGKEGETWDADSRTMRCSCNRASTRKHGYRIRDVTRYFADRNQYAYYHVFGSDCRPMELLRHFASSTSRRNVQLLPYTCIHRKELTPYRSHFHAVARLRATHTFNWRHPLNGRRIRDAMHLVNTIGYIGGVRSLTGGEHSHITHPCNGCVMVRGQVLLLAAMKCGEREEFVHYLRLFRGAERLASDHPLIPELERAMDDDVNDRYRSYIVNPGARSFPACFFPAAAVAEAKRQVERRCELEVIGVIGEDEDDEVVVEEEAVEEEAVAPAPRRRRRKRPRVIASEDEEEEDRPVPPLKEYADGDDAAEKDADADAVVKVKVKEAKTTRRLPSLAPPGPLLPDVCDSRNAIVRVMMQGRRRTATMTLRALPRRTYGA